MALSQINLGIFELQRRAISAANALRGVIEGIDRDECEIQIGQLKEAEALIKEAVMAYLNKLNSANTSRAGKKVDRGLK